MRSVMQELLSNAPAPMFVSPSGSVNSPMMRLKENAFSPTVSTFVRFSACAL